MGKFEDMILGLQQDTEIPEGVWARYTDTLANLPDQPEKRYARHRRWKKYVASAAAVAFACTAACGVNPALAARVPIIGRIFVQVQQISDFSGEYDGRAEVLQGESDGGKENVNPEYTVESAGVTFTASEIYCDGLSVFLTARVEVAQGGLQNIPGKIMYLEGSWKAGAEGKEEALINNNLEGKAVDDRTFIGMLKLDLEDTDMQDGTVALKLSGIGYDDIREEDAEDIGPSHRMEGEWALELPFTVDVEAVKRIPVNQESGGYCLKEVFVSPYQVVAYTEVPYREKKITREEFDEMMKKKTGGAADPGLTYEEYMERQGKVYEPCDTLIFDQDGERLQSWGGYQGRFVSAVEGKTLSKLYVYVFDDLEACLETEKEGMDSAAADKALVLAEVEVNQD